MVQGSHNQPEMMNYCAGYAAINAIGTADSIQSEFFRDEDVDRSKLEHLQASDLVLNPTDEKRVKRGFVAGVFDAVEKYIEKPLPTKSPSGRDLSPLRVKTIHQIPVQQTILHTFPAFDRDEKDITQMSGCMHDISEQLGVNGENMQGKKMMIKGDQLTVQNAWYIPFPTSVYYPPRLAMEQQEESSLVSQLNYFEPVAGLFHFKMAILNLLFRGHRRQDDEVGSLRFCIEKMNRNVGMWNWKDRTIKDFRACSSFFTHLIDAHILAALAATSGVGHLRDLWQELGTKDWRKIIQQLHTNFGESLLVSDWRHGEDDSRDVNATCTPLSGPRSRLAIQNNGKSPPNPPTSGTGSISSFIPSGARAFS